MYFVNAVRGVNGTSLHRNIGLDMTDLWTDAFVVALILFAVLTVAVFLDFET